MEREEPGTAQTRGTRSGGTRRGGLAAAALLVATAGLGLAATTTSADAAPKKKPAVAVTKVAGVPKSTTAGAGFTVSTTVRNAGKKAAKATVALRLSRDAKADGRDQALASVKTGKLRPRATKRVQAAVRLPRTLTAGGYYVLACVGSTCKAAKTTVLTSDSPPPASTDRGTLIGKLSFARTTPSDTWTSVDDEVQVDVAMNYKGPFAVSNDLVSTGSAYSYDLKRTRSSVSGPCTETTSDLATGGRPLVVTGDRYTDEIYGSVVYNDFTEIGVNLTLEYPLTEKVTKGGDQTCAQGTTERSHRQLDILSMRLAQVSRAGSDITYQVKSITGANGTPTTYWTVSGTLTLHLG